MRNFFEDFLLFACHKDHFNCQVYLWIALITVKKQGNYLIIIKRLRGVASFATPLVVYLVRNCEVLI